MGAFDYVLLALLGTYTAFAARRLRKKDTCSGNCGACRSCTRAKE